MEVVQAVDVVAVQDPVVAPRSGLAPLGDPRIPLGERFTVGEDLFADRAVVRVLASWFQPCAVLAVDVLGK
ncbi:hypothetical protein [Amycolatopsis sp. cmx-11-32]|uniref:hypothetical protein n=1 Tax=Amycolatopsis sp. cmx-11-32 TaxID=2785796 RepID=UPI0039E39258